MIVTEGSELSRPWLRVLLVVVLIAAFLGILVFFLPTDEDLDELIGEDARQSE